jgi:gliding motility-associated-like protein
VRKISIYRILFTIFFCGKATIALPQNLVPNWSFEEFNDSCTNPTSFENVKDWYPKQYLQGALNAIYTFGSPDYYAACSAIGGYFPPDILGLGFQSPYEKGSFTGIIYHQSAMNPFEREAIRIELKESLKHNICYHAEMFVNFGNNSTYVCDKLGMNFTVDSFPMMYDGSIPMPTPQIYTNDLIDDTLNWVKIEGDFTANGGEKWLTIGWFFPASDITYNLVGDTTATGIVTSAYYLIDAVKVHPCTDDEEAIILTNGISPNGDGKNDFYVIDSLPPNSRVSFYNRWGNEVYRSDHYNNEWEGKWNGQLLPTGTYFVVVEMPHGTRKSTFVELMY